MSIGTAIFNTSLVCYPLYQTSQLFSGDEAAEEAISAADRTRLLRFWFVFGGLGIAEEFGVSTIPGYYLLKAGLMVSLYSDVHSKIVNDIFLGKMCRQYIGLSERAIGWWKQQAAPQVSDLDKRAGGWLSSIKNGVLGWVGFAGKQE